MELPVHGFFETIENRNHPLHIIYFLGVKMTEKQHEEIIQELKELNERMDRMENRPPVTKILYILLFGAGFLLFAPFFIDVLTLLF